MGPKGHLHMRIGQKIIWGSQKKGHKSLRQIMASLKADKKIKSQDSSIDTFLLSALQVLPEG